MTDAEILSRVDHTILSPEAARPAVLRICAQAVFYNTASVCIPPSRVGDARENYPRLNICTVIGFPLGYSCAEAKIAEAQKALGEGADEFDMVINIGAVKDGNFGFVEGEIGRLKKEAGAKILKVIIETCYLSEAEKIELCKRVSAAGADYIKTSTGFGAAGAVLRDIELFKLHIGAGVKIKAAGGIRTREDMVRFIDAGCDRLGTSSAVKILGGETAGGY